MSVLIQKLLYFCPDVLLKGVLATGEMCLGPHWLPCAYQGHLLSQVPVCGGAQGRWGADLRRPCFTLTIPIGVGWATLLLAI